MEAEEPTAEPAEPTAELAPAVGFMVGVMDDGNLRIGEVLALSAEHVTIQLYRGQRRGVWKLVKTNSDRTVTAQLRTSDIVDGLIFTLTRTERLPSTIAEKIAAYQTVL